MGEACVICLQPLGMWLASAGCVHHHFHEACLTRWKLEREGDDAVKCPVCAAPMEDCVILKLNPEYFDIQSPSPSPPTSSKYYLTCQICDKNFRNTSAKTQHVQSFHSNKIYLCKCGKAYKTKNNLGKHIRIATNTVGSVVGTHVEI